MKEHTYETKSGIYRITSEGNVFTQSKLKIPLVTKGMEFTGKFKEVLKPERALSTTINNRGYKAVYIMSKTLMVHRLVAKHFIPNPDNKPFVNHIDGNKLNNDVSNLEWCTCAENNAHARATGLHVQAKGYTPKYKSSNTKKKSLANLKDNSKFTDKEVRYLRSVFIPRHKEFSATALASKYNVDVSTMHSIVTGRTYKHVK